MTRKLTEVAAAVIERPGEFLLAQRPAGKPYPGYWEFPGGKIEPGEDARAALVRELREELGIEVREASPWITRVYEYTHARVRLHFFRVGAWDGEPQPLEDQSIAWQRPGAADVSPMLPANAPVLAALALPPVMVVSNIAAIGMDEWLRRLSLRVRREPMLVQLREKSLDADAMRELVTRTLEIVEGTPARVVVNRDCGVFAQAHGEHWPARVMAQASHRPEGRIVGASCHNVNEIEQAERLGVDYIVVGPVKATASHPGASALGWDAFAALAVGRSMPVYAIGGLTRADALEARRHGAHGVALLSDGLSAD